MCGEGWGEQQEQMQGMRLLQAGSLGLCRLRVIRYIAGPFSCLPTMVTPKARRGTSLPLTLSAGRRPSSRRGPGGRDLNCSSEAGNKRKEELPTAGQRAALFPACTLLCCTQCILGIWVTWPGPKQGVVDGAGASLAWAKLLQTQLMAKCH